ncbi:MAG: hypothetical protein AAF757_21055, partial [Cyanobacteria bacterium P01_D01_bin.116]
FNNWLTRVAIDIGSAHGCLANLLASTETLENFDNLNFHEKDLEQNFNLHLGVEFPESLALVLPPQSFPGNLRCLNWIGV